MSEGDLEECAGCLEKRFLFYIPQILTHEVLEVGFCKDCVQDQLDELTKMLFAVEPGYLEALLNSAQ